MTPLRRIVAVVKGSPASVVAAWRRLAAAAPAAPAASSPAPPFAGGGRRTAGGAPRCAECGSLFLPRPSRAYDADSRLCRNCAGHPSTVLQFPLGRLR